MDLALELGTTVEELRRRMPATELTHWALYAKTRGLPARRIELYLAQIAWAVATFMAGSKASLDDFIIDFDAKPEEDAEDVEAVKLAFGFNPRYRKKR